MFKGSDIMNFLDTIDEETILIIPNNIKSKILRYIDSLDKLINIKIFDFNEIKHHIFFDYDEDALLYLMDQYNYKYDVSKILIDNMYYVENKQYKSEKLNQLCTLNQELEDQQLLKKDNLFLQNLSSKQVIVYGYDYIDKFQSRILSYFDNVKIIDSNTLDNKNITVYEGNTLLDESNFVLSQIAKLIDEGIDINKIKITNIDTNYNHTLTTLSKMYNIPINISKNSSIISTSICKIFLEKLNIASTLTEAVEMWNNEITVNNINSKIYEKIITICNNYIKYNYPFNVIKEAIIYKLKNTKLPNKNLVNCVEVVPFSNTIFLDDEYVFLMGFNQGVCPSIAKDEDYISDALKEELDLSLTNEINLLEKKAVIRKINSIQNLVISYKLKSISEDFYPSNLIKELAMNVEKITLDTIYSKEFSMISLGKMLDELIKYDYKDNMLDSYYNSILIPYMQYDNKYTGISKEKLIKKLNNKLLLSYSTIDNYYRCAFRYYIASVLKIDKYCETFKTFVGNLFHYILSVSFNDDFDLNKEWDNYIKDKELSVSEQFFLVKLKNELKLIIDEVRHLHKETGLTDNYFEKKIYIDKSKDIPVTFMGIVDKIMYKSVNGEELISIIDYKTGNPSTSLYNIVYGIDMQLPVYLYLVKYSNLFTNPKFVGFYLQKILHNEILKSNNKTYLDQKKDNLKLIGYSTTDEGMLSRFDPTYENSEFIKSMKITSKGFYAYAKVIEDVKIGALINLVDEKINSAIEDILSAKFDINPKRIGMENVGCAFCKYKDICYMKEEDIVNLKEYKDFSFLGGDVNA